MKLPLIIMSSHHWQSFL